MGFGSYPEITLARARQKAEIYRRQRAEGLDPIVERDKEKMSSGSISVAAIVEEAFEAHKATLKGDGEAGRWMSPLKLHVLPHIGAMDICEVDQNLVRQVILPLWTSKQPTAEKALNRLNICIRYAAAKGLPVNISTVPHTKILLGKGQHKARHIPAMDWRDVPSFYATLSDFDVTHLALRLQILSPGQRTAPLRYMRFDQISDGIWTIPGDKMKGIRGRTPDFKIPLSDEALHVIALAQRLTNGPFVFASRVSKAAVITDATLSKFMARQGLAARPHGFRSSFSTWARETGQRYDVREMCLAHKVGTDVERAYMRSDLLNERREMMQRWSDWVAGQTTSQKKRS